MASEQIRQELAAAVNRIDGIDSAKLLRKNLGDESLEGVFSKDLEKINSLAAFARQHAAIVHDSYASQAIGTFNNIAHEMETQAVRSSAEYISYRASFLQSVRQHVEDARSWLPMFAGSAVLERGFLEDEGIRREYERVVEDLNERNQKPRCLRSRSRPTRPLQRHRSSLRKSKHAPASQRQKCP